MDNSEYNNIDDYLLGRLKGDALSLFEQQLKVDMNLAKKVRQQKEAMDLLAQIGDVEMKREVQEVQKKYQNKEKPKSLLRILRPWLAAAAVLLVLIIAYQVFQKPTTDELIDDYYIAYNVNFGDRSKNDAIGIKLAEASLFYRQRDYSKALSIFETLDHQNDGKLQLATGISYFETGAYDKAIQLFDQLVNEKDPVFQYHGLWYAALAHLKSGSIEVAKTKLEQLIQSESDNGVYKQNEARELLKKLSS